MNVLLTWLYIHVSESCVSVFDCCVSWLTWLFFFVLFEISVLTQQTIAAIMAKKGCHC
jgi:hypothetical protein